MLEQVRRTIEEYHMAKGGRVIVGLSGGADSVCLLHILRRLAPHYGWELQAVHIHHGLRGAEADRDAAFAMNFAQSLGVSCQVVSFDMAAEARKQGRSTEEMGRILRYETFSKLAGENGQIAVAHHANDQAETLLMRLCRGTGLLGLTGMAPVRGNIIRPLLFCSRKEIEAYCKENGLMYQEDSTNKDTAYTRNKIRHEALPLLEEVHGGSTAHLAETAALLAADSDFLEQAAKAAYAETKLNENPIALSCEKLSALHRALRMRVLRYAMADMLGSSKNISHVHLQDVESLLTKQSGTSVKTAGGLVVSRQYDRLIFGRAEKMQAGFSYAIPLGTDVFVQEAELLVESGVFSGKREEIPLDGCTNVFDYDKITQDLCCRTRKAGDQITLPGGTKKLKSFFIDEKIPAEERGSIPLIACGRDIVWIYGGRTSAKFAPDAQTTQYVWIRITEAHHNERKN